MKRICVLIACRIYKKSFKIFRKSLVKAIQISEIGENPCIYLPKSLAIEGAKSALGLHHLTLRVQVQPQKNTKCRPWFILTKMRENLALLCYGFSHFRQVKSGIRCKNTRYIRLETDFRSKETRQFFSSFFFRHELQDGSILVQDPMLMVNCSLSTPITILPDCLFIYKELAAKLCGIYHYDASRTNTKFLQKHY